MAAENGLRTLDSGTESVAHARMQGAETAFAKLARLLGVTSAEMKAELSVK